MDCKGTHFFGNTIYMHVFFRHYDTRTAHPGLSPQFSEAKGKPLSIKKFRSVSGFRHLSVQEGGTGPETETEDIRTPPYNEQGSRKEADKRRVSGVFTNDTGSGKRRNKFKVKSGPSPPFSIYRRQNTVRTSLARPSAIRWATSPRTSTRATNGFAASTYFIRWATTLSACLPNSTPFRRGSTPP